MDGTHIGCNAAPVVKDFYKNKSVNLDSLYFDDSYECLEDYVIIAGDKRTSMGTFSDFFCKRLQKRSTPLEQTQGVRYRRLYSGGYRRFLLGRFRACRTILRKARQALRYHRLQIRQLHTPSRRSLGNIG